MQLLNKNNFKKGDLSMKRRFWTKLVAGIMSIATVLSVVSLPAVAPLAEASQNTQQVDHMSVDQQKTAAISALQALSQLTTAKADTSSVPNKSLGVDVSAYQGTDMSGYARAGARFSIVKTTEGTNWVNSKAAAQIASAKANGMMVMGYHFAHCGGNVNAARNEANYAINHARAMGVPQHSYIAMDFETDASGNKQANTNAAITFMQTVRNAGYLPLFYSGSYYMTQHFDTEQIVKAFPGSLWIASYKVMGRQDTPDFNYFPSRNGIAIWQFTDNLKGMGVDGNINVLPLNFLVPEQPAKPSNPTYQTTVHFLDSQNSNREVGTQKVSGHNGDKVGYSVPNNYHANSGQSNQVTVSNNGNVNVYVSHNTESEYKNESLTRIVKGALTNTTTGTTATYQYSQTKQVPVNGTKDLVTGQTSWSATPSFDSVFGTYEPNFANDAAQSKFSYSNQFDHIKLDGKPQVTTNGHTQTISVAWTAAGAQASSSSKPASSSSESHNSSRVSSSESHSSSSQSSSDEQSSSSSESQSSASSESHISSSQSSSSESHQDTKPVMPGSDTDDSKIDNTNHDWTEASSVRTIVRTITFEFADGTKKVIKQNGRLSTGVTATNHKTGEVKQVTPPSFSGWDAVKVPQRNGEVANAAEIPGVANESELRAYENSNFAKTYGTDNGLRITIKYAKNETTKSDQGSSQNNQGSKMGTEAKKETEQKLHQIAQNPSALSKAKNMTKSQADAYQNARNSATQMNSNYNGSPERVDRHNYVGDLPQTGDQDKAKNTAVDLIAVVALFGIIGWIYYYSKKAA